MQLEQAIKRAQRRNALWVSAQVACGSYEEFRANSFPIEKAIANQLAREFPN